MSPPSGVPMSPTSPDTQMYNHLVTKIWLLYPANKITSNSAFKRTERDIRIGLLEHVTTESTEYMITLKLKVKYGTISWSGQIDFIMADNDIFGTYQEIIITCIKKQK